MGRGAVTVRQGCTQEDTDPASGKAHTSGML